MTAREARLSAILIVVCLLAVAVKSAAGATVNGCTLAQGSYQLNPIVVPACASLAACDPAGTAYLNTGSLVLPAGCAADAGRVFANSFEPAFAVATTRGVGPRTVVAGNRAGGGIPAGLL